LTFSNQRW